MAQDDSLTLGAGLIRKGQARGQSPAEAAVAEPSESVSAAPASPVPAPSTVVAASPSVMVEAEPPPLRAQPPEDVPKRFTSFRLPVSVDEQLRDMIYETRRSKQDLLLEFVNAGLQRWHQERLKRR
jgi:hypothetical protein